MSIFNLCPQELHVIRKYRQELYNNTMELPGDRNGAGSKTHLKTIRQAAKMMSVHPLSGRILYTLALDKPDTIFEFGTAFGISTMYLAAGNPGARVITVEGNRQLALLAKEAFERYDFRNISVINQNFDDVISDLSKEVTPRSLVFIDGNHNHDATLEFYHLFSVAGTLVFDDIRWSEGMKTAWKTIKKTARSRRIIDLWKLGIITL